MDALTPPVPATAGAAPVPATRKAAELRDHADHAARAAAQAETHAAAQAPAAAPLPARPAAVQRSARHGEPPAPKLITREEMAKLLDLTH